MNANKKINAVSKYCFFISLLYFFSVRAARQDGGGFRFLLRKKRFSGSAKYFSDQASSPRAYKSKEDAIFGNSGKHQVIYERVLEPAVLCFEPDSKLYAAGR